MNKPTPTHGIALHVAAPPELDGSLDGFDAGAPITLDYDDQYRRSETPYPGPEEFSATALVNWDQDAIYLGVDVVKAEAIVRADDAPPLRLDNEPDDIHTDGLQIYVRPESGGPIYGILAVLADDAGRIRASPIAGTAATADMADGAWRPTGTGYAVTLRLRLPDWSPRGGDRISFDLLINEMHPDRLRRAGQLVWSGGAGWVYLRGDRHAPEAFGTLELG
jgi:hypothetical protein